MTDGIYFDSDCLSAFLWVRNENLLAQLYKQIIIPRQVYQELSFPGIAHLKRRIDTLIENQQANIAEILVGSKEYDLYYELTVNPKAGHLVIGKGEAAAISLAKEYGGVVASNNLRDIEYYIREFDLKHTTTADILVEALHRRLITEEQGNRLWAAMLAKRRQLGAATFSTYLATHF